MIAYFGVFKADAVVTAVNPLYREGELKGQLCDSGAQTIVVLDVLCPIVEKIKDETLLKNVIVVTDSYSKRSVNKTSLEVLNFGNLSKKEDYGKPLDLLFKLEEDLTVLQYTGALQVLRRVLC